MQSLKFNTRSKFKPDSYQIWFNPGDAAFKITVVLCSLLVIGSVLMVSKKLRHISPLRAGLPPVSGKLSKTHDYPRDLRISL